MRKGFFRVSTDVAALYEMEPIIDLYHDNGDAVLDDEDVPPQLDELVRLSPDNERVAEEIWREACRAFLPEDKAAFRKAFHKGKRALERAGLIEQDAAGNYWRKMK